MAQNFLSQITGSFAFPAAENPTVAMVEAAYRHHKLDFRYLNCEVPPEKLGDAVKGARAMNWVGFNCSIPHKVAVIDHLDGLGTSAEIIGAVNTIVRRGDKLMGENTDGRGFVKAMREAIDPSGKRVVLFGAGGAARAVAVEMALAGAAQILVVNRSKERAAPLVSTLNSKTGTAAEYHSWDSTFNVPPGTDILINATSIGLFPDVDGRLDVDMRSIQPDMVVADGIHNPPETLFIRGARAQGCRTLDGLGMLVNQGVLGVQYWTGVEVDARVMRGALEEIFGLTPKA
ncbi:shikimate dehydrogenase [Aestuariivirga litoralis]|uniref:shikimate dehydrogenase n=1 Tax=Aestuariivirga litoralis TaxID=2650924 RepID=UPI0018C70F92|nr:shikimate dehydrogenase [Aestuariivirga litoralis]MBG1231372.1 shikimate dehydrogenase [Aestuariivirga litoralis]